ncbi:MAG: hypothetical protein IJH17_01315, partial [Clostridia bacterium]|nr:hypothetical protein [Clostridia bacterium]
VKIAGVNKDDIVRLAKELLDSEDAYTTLAHAATPYGDGEASRRTVEAILYAFGSRSESPDNFRVTENAFPLRGRWHLRQQMTDEV